MCKSKFWSLLVVLGLCVFMFSGCGGSADTESSDDKKPEGPNDYPDSYNTQNMLNGTWVIIDDKTTEISTASGDETIRMQLITASMTFSDTKIYNSSGLTSITSRETWHIFLDTADGTTKYLGKQAINLDNQVVSMVQIGSDKWKCEIYDEYRTLLNIELLSDKRIQVYERRILEVNNSYAMQYEITFNMRKPD